MSCKNCGQKDWVAVKDFSGAFISVPPQAFKLIQRMRDNHEEALHALGFAMNVLEDFNASPLMRSKRRAVIRAAIQNGNGVLNKYSARYRDGTS
jgi:hypothetical protein